MLSHGYITTQTVDKMQGRHIRQDGPISYSETTTKDSVFKEDANRCLQVETNASPELTERVLKAGAAEYLPGPACATDEARRAKERHWEFQRALEYQDVRIPFADVLAEAMPPDRIEVRRVFKQVLALIEAVAFLHQFQRGRNADGQLEATVDDYAVARAMVLGPLHAAIGLGKEYREGIAFARKLPTGRRFSGTEAGKLLGANSRKVLKTWMDDLYRLGLVRCVQKANGNQPAWWERTGKDVDELLLPSVATVRGGLR
jgi:hypothetical protein